MAEGWEITVVSDVEADALCAEVLFHGELWASILDRGDGSALTLETYPRSAPRRRSDTWRFDLSEALAQLTEARSRLR